MDEKETNAGPVDTEMSQWKELTFIEAAPILPVVAFGLALVIAPPMRDRYFIALAAVCGAALLYAGHLIDGWAAHAVKCASTARAATDLLHPSGCAVQTADYGEALRCSPGYQ